MGRMSELDIVAQTWGIDAASPDALVAALVVLERVSDAERQRIMREVNPYANIAPWERPDVTPEAALRTHPDYRAELASLARSVTSSATRVPTFTRRERRACGMRVDPAHLDTSRPVDTPAKRPQWAILGRYGKGFLWCGAIWGERPWGYREGVDTWGTNGPALRGRHARR